jgi:hypothetical protein
MTRNIVPADIRFWKNVNKNGSRVDFMESVCWEYVCPRGNRASKSSRPTSFNLGHHETAEIGRASWILSGNDPTSDFILRRCKNKLCVRPDHLYTVKRGEFFAKEFIGHDGKLYKRCSMCRALYEFTLEFFSPSGGWNGKLSCRCKRCSVIASKESEVRGWKRVLLYRMRDKKKTGGVPCDMTEDDLQDLYDEQLGKCYWLGVDLEPSPIHRYPAKISPDRLNRQAGYTKDNVVLTSVFANVGRNSCDVLSFVEYMKKNMDVFGKGVWVHDDKWERSTK